jgi:hypothetical protein
MDFSPPRRAQPEWKLNSLRSAQKLNDGSPRNVSGGLWPGLQKYEARARAEVSREELSQALRYLVWATRLQAWPRELRGLLVIPCREDLTAIALESQQVAF